MTNGTETYSFGEWLKQRRERLRLTQRELAATVHCSVAMIKKIEADERHPSPELAGLLASSLKIPEPDREIFIEFDHSWNLLASAEQNALMWLSVFRGGWQAEEGLPVADADLLLLRRLVDKSLVRVGESGRYDLHELIRQYASHKLGQSGHENETRQRHFDAYRALAARLDAQQFGPEAMAAVACFDQEQDNIGAALAWSLDAEQTEAALRLLVHLVPVPFALPLCLA